MIRNTYENEKMFVLKWMAEYCCGVERSRTKEDILPHIRYIFPNLNDVSLERQFRRIMSELKDEELIGATSSKGYWAFPNDLTRNELEAKKASAVEMCSRAAKMYKRNRRIVKKCENQLRTMEYQPDFFKIAG